MDILHRFYIRTKDNLFFAVTNYQHPDSHIISFLRYVPSDDGDRMINGIKYKKLSSNEAYSYIKEHHSDYLVDFNVENKKMMGVLREDVAEILSPIERLNEIINSDDNDDYYDKIRLLSKTFHEEADISYEDMGVTGSTLINLQNNNTSDIDFIVYGLDNHRKAIEYFGKNKNNPDSPLNRISGDYWEQVYHKRIFDDTMDFDEFIWYEDRKNNRGLINGTLFDIHLSRKSDEVAIDNFISKQMGKMKISARIVDDTLAYDSPAIYKISNQNIVEGPCVEIEEIISFTHTYAGIVKNNEEVIVSGVCEEMTDKITGEKKYSIIVGTTRESLGEYIKLKENPLKKERNFL